MQVFASRWLLLAGALVLSPAPSIASTISCVTEVPAGLVVLETWEEEGSPYCITGDILVSQLTIEPGVTVVVDGPYEIRVSTITAIGTQQRPIRFTSGDAGGSCWKGLRFENAAVGSNLTHVVIEDSDDSAITILDGPAPVLADCVIRNNRKTGSGGGIDASGVTSDMSVTRCSFSGNSASDNGGALRVTMGEIPGEPSNDFYTLTVTDSLFHDNRSNPEQSEGDRAGGAIFFTRGNMRILRSTFLANRSDSQCSGVAGCIVTSRGGAIYQAAGDTVIRNSEFIGNVANARNDGDCDFAGDASIALGGGVFLDSGTLTVDNSVFSCNSTMTTESLDGSSCGPGDRGGGLAVDQGSATVTNCTIARHPNSTGVARAGGVGTLNVTNSIIYGNTDGQVGGFVSVTYSDVEQADGEVYPGVGNINEDPVFFGTGCIARDFLLVPGSPCIDGGDPGAEFADSCFPPSSAFGGTGNDMGAFGGPLACDWRPQERSDLRFTSKETLEWRADSMFVESAASYSLYRGTLGLDGWVYDHACLEADILTGTALDDEPIDQGVGFYYLVGGETPSGGAGTLGNSSIESRSCQETIRTLAERPNDAACHSP